MKITKRQLRRIIKEEKQKLLREAPAWPEVEFPSENPYDDKIDPETKKDIELDMDELLQILDTAAAKANEIRTKMDNSNYAEWAGGREADDLQLWLIKVWRAMGFEGEDL